MLRESIRWAVAAIGAGYTPVDPGLRRLLHI